MTQVGSMSLGMGQKIFLSMGPIEISGWVKGAIDYIVLYHHGGAGNHQGAAKYHQMVQDFANNI